jgi:beta-lactamase class A
MITKSDNTATDMLINLVGMENVEETAGKFGMKNTTLQRKIYDFEQIDQGRDNLTTPEDMYFLFYNLYEDKDLSEASGEELVNILKGQKNMKMIPKYLPENVSCAHKTGGLTGIVHDCGIIYPPSGKPYILILMGKNVTDTEGAEEKFAILSKKIYYYIMNL